MGLCNETMTMYAAWASTVEQRMSFAGTKETHVAQRVGCRPHDARHLLFVVVGRQFQLFRYVVFQVQLLLDRRKLGEELGLGVDAPHLARKIGRRAEREVVVELFERVGRDFVEDA